MRTFIASLIGLLAINCAIAATSVSEYATGEVSRSAMLSAKRGTVVDAASGAGIADATVIASWHIHSTGWERDSGGCVVRRIVQTDASGHFTLPDVSAEHWFHPPHVSLAERARALAGTTDFAWYLAVFKPGFLREGDATTLARYTTMDPTFLDWEWRSPRTTAARDGYRVASIKLQKDNLSSAQELLYAWKLFHFANDCENTNPPPPPSPEFSVVVKDLKSMVRPIPCSLPELTPIPAWAAKAFSGLGGGGDWEHEPFFQGGRGNADGFFKRMSDATRGGPIGWRDTNAGTLCWAQGGRETKP